MNAPAPNLGAAMQGGRAAGQAPGRHANDFYPTPAAVTDVLIDHWLDEWCGENDVVWEPAAGNGAMVRRLSAAGIRTIGSDLHAYTGPDGLPTGYQSGVDFLSAEFPEALWALPRGPRITVVTNPPFKLAAAFVERAAALMQTGAIDAFAFFLKATFWHARSRLDLFHRAPPALVLPLTWRPDFDGRGCPTMDCMWNVWTPKMIPGQTRYLPIPRTEDVRCRKSTDAAAGVTR